MATSRLPSPRQLSQKLALAITVTVTLLCAGHVNARDGSGAADIATTPYQSLPAEARQVEQAVRQGGPFRYDKDGMVFGNRERRLPARARGYYREYTVDTPGAHNRGARRIVCGGAQPTQPEACYYTSDHYTSFSRIVN